MVQEDFGYTATWAGLLLAPGGLVTMVMFAVVGRISSKFQPKYLIIVGVFAALSMGVLINVYGDLGFWFFARSRIWLGIGLPLIFTPIITASYDGLPSGKTDQASALLNAARNTGGSISLSSPMRCGIASSSIRICSSARRSLRASRIRTRCTR